MTEEQAVRYGTGEACLSYRTYRQTYPIYSGLCRQCSDVFFCICQNRSNQFCNRICSGKFHRGITLEKRICPHCGSEYSCPPSDDKRFCNTSCSASFQWKRDGKRERFVDSHGYVKVRARNHPRASKYGSHVAEHALVMERHLGRYLLPGENVHHKNGIRTDNRLDNLELWVTYQPSGQRVSDLITFVVDNYEKEIRGKLEVKDIVRAVIKRVETEGTLAEEK